MSAPKTDPSTKSFQLTGPWAGAWKVFAGLGVLGLVGAGIGFASDPRRFAFSWLFGFFTVLTMCLGTLFFVLVQRLVSANWSVTVRRTAEFFATGVIVMLPLFLPVLLTMNHLFPWLESHDAAHEQVEGREKHGSLNLITPAYAQEHAAPHGDKAAPSQPNHGAPSHGEGDVTGHLPGSKLGVPSETGDVHGTDHPQHAAASGHGKAHGPMGDPHEAAEREVLKKKAPYLNKTFFLIRVAIYFLVWIGVAFRMFKLSTDQDKSKDPKLTLSAQALAPASTFLFALTLTGAAVDWIMSLDPTWFSTIFGVIIFAGGVVSSYAAMILVLLGFRNEKNLSDAFTVEHFHDLGKLMFGFTAFWAYVQFSQFMLIWYAALPEETTFFHNRWDYAPWATVSNALILFHFIVPFFWTMSRNFKRNLGRLKVGAVILLVMHCVDIYWFVMPNFHLGKEGFSFSWIDIACLLANAGIYGAFVFYRMTQHAIVPVGDPRLARSLEFQNA